MRRLPFGSRWRVCWAGQRPVLLSIRRFLQYEQPVYRQVAGHGFSFSAGPGDFDLIDGRRVAQAEVEWHNALGKIAGLAVLPLREGSPARMDANESPDGVVVGTRADKSQLEPADLASGTEIADEHLGTIVELGGDDVQVPVVIEIENGSRARAQGRHDRMDAAVARAKLVTLVRAIAVQGEANLLAAAIGARLDAEREFRVEEALATLIEGHGVDAVTKRMPHAGGHEHVFESICVQVAHARPPGPVCFHAECLRSFQIG